MPGDRQQSILALLDYLAGNPTVIEARWQAWRITAVRSGFNNLLFRATSPDDDLAIKFTQRDHRYRAVREYWALSALCAAGLAVAPRPVLLDVERYGHLAIVQSWLEGPVHAAPPAGQQEWDRLLRHLAKVHELKPECVHVPLPQAVLTFTSAADGVERVLQQLVGIADARWPHGLRELMDVVQSIPFPNWQAPRLTLCRVDPNLLNFIRRPNGWLSVDWENSGWGDPAFEIADLLAHPTCLTVTREEGGWVMQRYVGLDGDSSLPERMAVYYPLMLAWWTARFARMRDDLTSGQLQPRLARKDPLSLEQTEARYEQYLRRALLALAEF